MMTVEILSSKLLSPKFYFSCSVRKGNNQSTLTGHSLEIGMMILLTYLPDAPHYLQVVTDLKILILSHRLLINLVSNQLIHRKLLAEI